MVEFVFRVDIRVCLDIGGSWFLACLFLERAFPQLQLGSETLFVILILFDDFLIVIQRHGLSLMNDFRSFSLKGVWPTEVEP
jgi:hypothetical protein